MRRRFEYKIVKDWLSEEELNELGEQGWELRTRTVTRYGVDPDDTNIVYIFIREKE